MKNNELHLLVVDDDKLIGAALKTILPANWKCTYVSNPNLIPFDQFYHAAMVDMHLSGTLTSTEGPGVIKKLLEFNPQLEVVAMSGDLNREIMEKVLKVGAQKFLAKPLSPEEVIITLEKIEALWNFRLIETHRGSDQARWIGSSSASETVKKWIATLRAEKGSVLIEGETGTGKEVTAQILNQQEPSRPFITVNIAGLAENLFESELFGHIKGAFTGADQNKMGLIEAANGGDLFIDEIEALPLNLQVKLLRFLESGEIKKVGSNQNLNIQTRVIAASNQPLLTMIQEKKFREDLYYRLSSHKITLPALRERSEDIPELATYFLSQVKPRKNKSFDPAAIEVLKKYQWPGNVRELKRVCEQLSLVSPLPIIRESDVRALLYTNFKTETQAESIELSHGLNTLVENYEAKVIKLAFENTKDIDKVCDVLKISKSNLYKKIKDYGLQGVL